LWWEVSQPARPGAASQLIELGVRPARIFAPVMLVGSVCFAIAAVWLLAHSLVGVTVLAEGPPGTAITMPAARSDDLEIWAVRPAGPRPDVTCTLATTSSSWVGMNFSPVTPTSKGRVLEAVADVRSGWNQGDTLTCTGDNVQTIVLGHNSGLTYLIQGLMATFVALGSAIMALIGFASRRRRSRVLAA
jgi:uncharacterized Zn-binding protein involved in type VI secretion